MRRMLAVLVMVVASAAVAVGETYLPKIKTEQTQTGTPIGQSGYTLQRLEWVKSYLAPTAGDPAHYEPYEQGSSTWLRRESDMLNFPQHDYTFQQKPLGATEWGPMTKGRDFDNYGEQWSGYPAPVRTALAPPVCADSDGDGVPDEWDPTPLPTVPTTQPAPLPFPADGTQGGFTYSTSITTQDWFSGSAWYHIVTTTHTVSKVGGGSSWWYKNKHYGGGPPAMADINTSGGSGTTEAKVESRTVTNCRGLLRTFLLLRLTPNPPTTQPGPDSDGDGWMDGTEDMAGTDSHNAGSTPANNLPGGGGWSPGSGDKLPPGVIGQPNPGEVPAPTSQPSTGETGAAQGQLNASLDKLYAVLRSMGLDMSSFAVSGEESISKSVTFMGHSYTVDVGWASLDWVRVVIRNLLLVGIVLYFLGLLARMLRQY